MSQLCSSACHCSLMHAAAAPVHGHSIVPSRTHPAANTPNPSMHHLGLGFSNELWPWSCSNIVAAEDEKSAQHDA